MYSTGRKRVGDGRDMAAERWQTLARCRTDPWLSLSLNDSLKF